MKKSTMSESRLVRIIWLVGGMLLFVLGVAIIAANLYCAVKGIDDAPSTLMGITVIVLGLAMIWLEGAERLMDIVYRIKSGFGGKGPADEATAERAVSNRVQQYRSVVGAQAPAPPPEKWYTTLRPVLHQAVQYSVPTYYLDDSYHIVDWNASFDLIFSGVAASLRGKHVNWFIAQLDNAEESFRHAQDFSDREIPLVDLEPLTYTSPIYGKTRFLKVASQLHDSAGEYRGWSVAMMVQDTNWSRFRSDLKKRLTEDKTWSVYAASYDAVLLNYEDYGKLINSVISVVSGENQVVVDLGAGTGNVTQALLDLGRGHSVTAVENNYAMLERLRAKDFDGQRVKVFKCSVEHLESLPDHHYDAAVMVNVLYAVDDPLSCLQGVNRILKRDAVIGLSTTYQGAELDTLLTDIEGKLKAAEKYEDLADDYARVEEINRKLEETAFQNTQEEYLDWLKKSGFELIRPSSSEYQGAVMVVHAKKVQDV